MTTQEAAKKFDIEMMIRINILKNVTINYNYSKHLFLNFSYTDLNYDWAIIRYNFLKILVIEFSKIFIENANQKYNLFKLLKQLDTGELALLGFPQNGIIKHRNELNNHLQFYLFIKKIRDSFYAHSDSMGGIDANQFFFNSIEKSINLGFEIINETLKFINGEEIINNINLTDISNLKVSGSN